MSSIMVSNSEDISSIFHENYVYYRKTRHPIKPVFKGLAGYSPQMLFIIGRYA